MSLLSEQFPDKFATLLDDFELHECKWKRWYYYCCLLLSVVKVLRNTNYYYYYYYQQLLNWLFNLFFMSN